MNDYDAFIQGIIEHPDDDLRRLVFADWLMEHDEPERAEFIRVQCKIAELIELGAHEGETCNVTGQCSDCHRESDVRLLRKREQELWEQYKCDWFGERWSILHLGHPEEVPTGTYPYLTQAFIYRGFVAEVHCPAEAWIANAPRLLRREPIRKVVLATPLQITGKPVFRPAFIGEMSLIPQGTPTLRYQITGVDGVFVESSIHTPSLELRKSLARAAWGDVEIDEMSMFRNVASAFNHVVETVGREIGRIGELLEGGTVELDVHRLFPPDQPNSLR